MKLSPPKPAVWWISFLCCVLAILMALNLVVIPALQAYVFWLAVGGLALLLLANRMPGL